MASLPIDPNSLLPNSQRKELVKQGIDYLEQWLIDMIRIGVLQYDFSHSSMREISSRMVDAKMGGVARRLRGLATLDKSDQNWLENLLGELASIYLLVSSFKKIDELPINLQHSIYSVSGFSIQKKQLATSDGIQDLWMIMGIKLEEEENLKARYCWVMGSNSKRSALLLDFAFGRTAFESQLKFSQSYHGKLVYYPGSFPFRGFLINPVSTPKKNSFPGTFPHFTKFLDVYAHAVSKNPFMNSFPVAVRDVMMITSEESWELVDIENNAIPISNASEKLWPLFASQGGDRMAVFGIWNGDKIELLSATIAGHHYQL
ncbi:MAG: hypothetical protein HKN76_11630 [Saprospiraceae bacterium]|nr:hypothetical protein [Saprospiraceae bacterium]